MRSYRNVFLAYAINTVVEGLDNNTELYHVPSTISKKLIVQEARHSETKKSIT